MPKCTFRQSLYHAVKEAEGCKRLLMLCGRVKTQRGVVTAVVFFSRWEEEDVLIR